MNHWEIRIRHRLSILFIINNGFALATMIVISHQILDWCSEMPLWILIWLPLITHTHVAWSMSLEHLFAIWI